MSWKASSAIHCLINLFSVHSISAFAGTSDSTINKRDLFVSISDHILSGRAHRASESFDNRPGAESFMEKLKTISGKGGP